MKEHGINGVFTKTYIKNCLRASHKGKSLTVLEDMALRTITYNLTT